MNEYKGYTLTDITINPNVSLSGHIYHLSEFKQRICESTIENFLDKFHRFVDDDIAKQSELTNCQNFANELVELCKKHKVVLSTDNESYLYVNGNNLRFNTSINTCKPRVNTINGNLDIDLTVSCI